MRRAVTAALVILAACQSRGGEDKTGAKPADRSDPDAAEYHRDVGRICDVEKLSGADAEETTARSIIAAEWLGRNIKTQRARDFLAEVARVGPADKARRLREEAEKAGLDSCPTALAWEQLPSAGSAAPK